MELLPQKMTINSDDNYDIKGFFKKKTFDSKGFLVQVDYYLNYDEVSKVFSTLMVNESRIYTQNSSGITTKRVMTITGYDGENGGTVMWDKTYTKIYDEEEGLNCTETARSYVLWMGKKYLIDRYGSVTAATLLIDFGSYIPLYLQGYTVALLDAINASVNPLIDETAKTALVTILDVTYSVA